MSRNQHDAAPEEPGGKRGHGDAGGAALSDAAVADYLRRHPDFLARHSELLDVLEPPARRDGDGVVDLQQFMVERLRGELARVKQARDDLLYTGRSNMAAQSRVHEACLAMLAAPTFEHLIETVTTDLGVILDLDAVTICVEQPDDGSPPTHIGGVHQLEPGAVRDILGRGRESLLLGNIEGDPLLFGSGAGLVRSAALLRLNISSATPPALLALGSREPEHFDPVQGSELLQFLARALELTVRAWLDLPE